MAVAYVLKFTDWFQSKNIQILFHARGGHAVFSLNGDNYKLTQVKVFRADDAATNKYPHIAWHLISPSGSKPVTEFVYGDAIEGMQPEVPNTVAEPLTKNVSYKIVIESGKIRAEQEFSLQ
jgi:hypothetical protein